MKSVLTTRKEIYQRFCTLMKNYKKSYDKINGLTEEIERYIGSIELELSEGEDFNDADLKHLLGNLNSHQTQLVNTIRAMNEYHAKMGYLVN